MLFANFIPTCVKKVLKELAISDFSGMSVSLLP